MGEVLFTIPEIKIKDKQEHQGSLEHNNMPAPSETRRSILEDISCDTPTQVELWRKTFLVDLMKLANQSKYVCFTITIWILILHTTTEWVW